MPNVYFDLTRELNAAGPIVILGSGQAVVYHRVTLASKDGDWILREEPAACARVLEVLAARGASYRPGAPLDVRWLSGGWSSHLEFLLEGRMRVRCDFFSRPPRLALAEVEALFAHAADGSDPLLVLPIEPLVRLKRTQRAKDYPILGELARRLPPEIEVELTTDAERVLELAPVHGHGSTRPAVQAALAGDEELVEVELVREMRAQRQVDRARVECYAHAAGPYLRALIQEGIDRLPLAEGHRRAVALAERLLPVDPEGEGDARATPR